MTPIYDDTKHTIELTDYEIANLREGLIFLREVGGDTGDWYQQVLSKLPDTHTTPNHTAQNQKRAFALRIGWSIFHG